MNLPNCKKPCKDCPFRKDSLKGWLGERRIKEIVNSDSFVCHKNHSLQCAGHMLLNNESNAFYNTAMLMGVSLNLSGSELIFDSKDECLKHHK